MPTFHIIYPRGDKAALKVLELTSSESHELFDYALASRHTHYDLESAVTSAKALAASNGLKYEPFKGDGMNAYLD